MRFHGKRHRGEPPGEPNVIAIYDVSSGEGALFIVMEDVMEGRRGPPGEAP